MSGKGAKREIIYWVIAGVLFAAAAFLLLPGKTGTLSEEKMVFFGDSVIGNVREEYTSVPGMLGTGLGINVYNAGFGGSGTARGHYSDQRDYSIDSLSFVALARAIANRDFMTQHTIQTKQEANAYFKSTVGYLENLDFSKTEVVFAYYGINDFLTGIPVENSGDPYDEYTFAGALRTAIAFLREANPDLRIVLISPAFFWTSGGLCPCTEYDNHTAGIEEYIAAQKKVAAELQVEYLDLFHGLFEHEEVSDWQVYTWDGIHPNENGRILIAGAIEEYMKNTK